MRKILNIIEEILKEEGNLKKMEKLKEHKDNEVLKLILKYNFDKKVTSNLSTKKINKVIKDKRIEKLKDKVVQIKTIEEYIDYLSNTCTGKDEDVLSVRTFIESFVDEDIQNFLKELATKDFKMVIGRKLINKVLDNLIPIFNVQLAFAQEKYPVKDTEEVSVTEKLDGNRCILYKKDGKSTFHTRAGLVIEGLNDLLEQTKNLPDNYVYDCEIIADIEGDSAEQYKATSTIMRTKGNKTGLNLFVFDVLPTSEFDTDGCTKTHKERREQLVDMFKSIKEKNVLLLKEIYSGLYDEEKIIKLYTELTDQGSEGIMLNRSAGMYECKRSKNILKVKKFLDMDLKIISVHEGKGLFSGKMGYVRVLYKGNEVEVGSGWNLLQREHYWEHPEELIGSIIKVKYFEISENSTGKKSLRFPVFKEIRTDKNEESYD